MPIDLSPAPPASLACLNGVIMPADEAKVSVWDRGFVFGDSVYEVCRIYNGRCWLEQEHFQRLERSLSELEIKGVDIKTLRQRAISTIRQSEIREGTLYIQISRGVAPRAHAFPNPPVAPTEFIAVKPYDDSAAQLNRQQGVTIISYPDLRWGRCDIKSTNLLANCMALEHVKRKGGFEAALIDHDGLLTEATHSSLLWVRNGQIQGTPLNENILPGCTRLIANLLTDRLSMKIHDTKIDLNTLRLADEVLLMGTTIEVMPVVKVDETTIGNGQPGPITRKLQQSYKIAIREWLEQTVVIR
ncbi:MAG: aminotransferase class IV [Planctomycetota bacterium]|nr:aminotransferase class IV [Planctomycetota bacterium]